MKMLKAQVDHVRIGRMHSFCRLGTDRPDSIQQFLMAHHCYLGKSNHEHFRLQKTWIDVYQYQNRIFNFTMILKAK